ncbi:hypothetical protein SAMN05216281_11513 [Cryobacterium luteum]|nr:hypothetical protein SAMN05216281_11513 [Cryobacterium luteum]
MRAKQKAPGFSKPKSLWSHIGNGIIIVGLLGCAAYFMYAGATGVAFDLRRSNLTGAMEHSAAASSGKVPFIANQLLWFPVALAFLNIFALRYLSRSDRQFWVIFKSGAASMVALCCVGLGVEIVWVASGVPFSNYSGISSSWTDPASYFWSIVAFSVCLLTAVGVAAVGVFAARLQRRIVKPGSSGRSRKPA